MNDVGAIKVVLNADLFVSRGVITSGFHGETRIIRHLFLKYLRKTDQAKQLLFGSLYAPGAAAYRAEIKSGGM
jgi:hypothetical protein